MPKKKNASYMKITIIGASITRDGKVVSGESIHYERSVDADGRVVEKGLPKGMKSNPSLEDLAKRAFGGTK
jgi:hypothetical protein